MYAGLFRHTKTTAIIVNIDIAATKILLGRYYISIENYSQALKELEETLNLTKDYIYTH